MTGEGTMGLLEFALLGAITWFIIWILWVFLQAIIYGALSSSTAFASYYIMTSPIDYSQAQPFLFLGNFAIGSVEIVVGLLLISTYVLMRRFWDRSEAGYSRFRSAFRMS